MSKRMKIPEWIGSDLMNGTFLRYAENVRDIYVGIGLADLSLTAVGMQLIEAIDKLHTAVNRESAYDETVEVARCDGNRDALMSALYTAWSRMCQLAPTHPFAPHVETLKSEMQAYKGVWKHELEKETGELEGLQAALSTEANQAALVALGLDKIAAALWAANAATAAAMVSRNEERGERAAEKSAGTTPELRKEVANLLVTAGECVNAVNMLNPENEKAVLAIKNVCGVIEAFKRIASEAKHRKGDAPEPEPTPEPEA